MKVEKAGTLFYDGHNVIHMHSWGWDLEGRSAVLTPESKRVFLRLALQHIAQVVGLELVEVEGDNNQSMTLDVERAALDAIAVARWKEQG